MAVAIGFGLANASLRPPPRAECDKSSAKYDAKEKHCEPPETFWERTLDDPIVLYTAFLTAFTAILAGVGIGQGALIYRQIQLGRDEFNATHRPKIVIREITSISVQVQESRVSFYVANAGEGTATIVEADMIVRAGEKDSDLARIDADPPNIVGTKLAAGERQTVVLKFQLGWAAYQNERNSVAWSKLVPYDPNLRIFVEGRIKYTDASNIPRNMAFSRKYDFRSLRFEAGDSDYEYSD